MPEVKPERIYTCNPNEVVVLNRQRKEMNKKQMKELCSAIERYGQLQPAVCRLDDQENPVLIAGERRLKACESLGIAFKFTLKEDITDEADIYEIELIENICREDLCWNDRVEAMLKLHELRQEEKGITRPGARGGHGVRDTADELHLSIGTVQEDIELALFAREIPEVSAAPNKTIARSIVRRIKDEVAREEALDEAIQKGKEAQGETVEINPDTPPEEVAKLKVQDRLVEFDKRCHLGDIFDVLQREEEVSFDVICFDPPWGVQLNEVSDQRGHAKTYEDEISVVREYLPKWLELIYSKMSENSHLYLFFGIVHHELIYSSLDEAGFKTNRMPLFWKKRGAHRTRAPKVWPGRCYEAIAYARKGKKDLAIMGAPDIIETQPPTKNMKLSHPSAKHPDIYVDLLKRSAAPGDKVIDPMAGSGMFGVACETLRTTHALDWYQIEIDKDFVLLQLHNLSRGYGTIVGESTAFGDEPIELPDKELPPLPEDFKGIEPGSELWKRFWKAHPNSQQEMLEWKASQ